MSLIQLLCERNLLLFELRKQQNSNTHVHTFKFKMQIKLRVQLVRGGRGVISGLGVSSAGEARARSCNSVLF